MLHEYEMPLADDAERSLHQPKELGVECAVTEY